MLPGKVPPEVLESIVFKGLKKNGRVLVGPGVGIDAAALDFGETILVASTDPITGAEERIGFYAVHVNANDVATLGAKPKWFLVTILLPEGADEIMLAKIMEEIRENAERLGVTIVGGHTEVTLGLKKPIVIGTMLGEVEREKLVIPRPRAGDAIVLTKGVGIEGTAIIAYEREEELAGVFGRSFVERAKAFIEEISVVEEAMIAREWATAMHDPTEGGVANGLHEMADVANLGFRVFAEKIPIRNETRKICRFYDLDPLALISSGTLLISVPRDHARILVEKLEARGIRAGIIGEFLAEKKRVIIEGGVERPLRRPESDELWKVV
ncbi:AIR synthase family protein [Pyrococcus yayanosii]|uniref:Hydrogenase expression/formation protein n=1 Tax=Pyrococcus yayanosii (strain CH1 / JCM 16557) TaxID=529709 RepID=F8AGZ2_PYRYC|nr:AIR synthase family protein [Pyrococcus yayanosii]AEH24050.1 hydrogenase expression/formation protein [Pyrococcus yayanosii CH1]